MNEQTNKMLDMIEEIEKINKEHNKHYRAAVIERNIKIRSIFNMIGMPCKSCNSCCCSSCGRENGWFRSSNIEDSYLLNDVKKAIINRDEKWNGFYDKDKGCMLPIGIRSNVCIFQICGTAINNFKKRGFGWVFDRIQEIRMVCNKGDISYAITIADKTINDLKILTDNKRKIS
jgi:Fe-S-cluster containining protein